MFRGKCHRHASVFKNLNPAVTHELGTLNTGCYAAAKDLAKFLSCVNSIGYLRSIMSLAKRPK